MKGGVICYMFYSIKKAKKLVPIYISKILNGEKISFIEKIVNWKYYEWALTICVRNKYQFKD